MGYDMYIENTPEGPPSGDDAGYFCLNIWRMGRYLDHMSHLGMLVTGYSRPSWPEKPDSVEWDDVSAVRYPDDHDGQQPVKPEAVTFAKTIETHLAWHPDELSGIAVHKFGSNDGWLVTPEEITGALESYRTHSGDKVKAMVSTEGLDRWLQWIGFLESAHRHGGFRVH